MYSQQLSSGRPIKEEEHAVGRFSILIGIGFLGFRYFDEGG
jgi:hypothetical protein